MDKEIRTGIQRYCHMEEEVEGEAEGSGLVGEEEARSEGELEREAGGAIIRVWRVGGGGEKGGRRERGVWKWF